MKVGKLRLRPTDVQIRQEVVGVSAKGLLAQRIALKGKRLLVHTGEAASFIAERLAFYAATNVVKFFRREADATPCVFRREHRILNRRFE